MILHHHQFEVCLLHFSDDVSVCHQRYTQCLVHWIKYLASIKLVCVVKNVVANIVEQVTNKRQRNDLSAELFKRLHNVWVDKLFETQTRRYPINVLITINIFVILLFFIARSLFPFADWYQSCRQLLIIYNHRLIVS